MVSGAQIRQISRKHNVSPQTVEYHLIQISGLKMEIERSTDEQVAQKVAYLRGEGRYYTAAMIWVLQGAHKQNMDTLSILDLVIGLLHSDKNSVYNSVATRG